MGYGGGTERGGNRRTQGDDPVVGDLLLHIWWSDCVYPGREVSEVVQHPHRPLIPCQSPYKHVEYNEHGLPVLLHA